MKRCITCGRNAHRFAEFPCPDCSERLLRCNDCRQNRNPFQCACGFAGP